MVEQRWEELEGRLGGGHDQDTQYMHMKPSKNQ